MVEEEKHPKWEEIRDLMKNGELVWRSDTLDTECAHFTKLINKKVLFDGFPINYDNISEWNRKLSDGKSLVCFVWNAVRIQWCQEL